MFIKSIEHSRISLPIVSRKRRQSPPPAHSTPTQKDTYLSLLFGAQTKCCAIWEFEKVQSIRKTFRGRVGIWDGYSAEVGIEAESYGVGGRIHETEQQAHLYKRRDERA